MSEEDLELLITLDEPWDGHEDTFNHLSTENADAGRPGQPLQPSRRHGQRTEDIVSNDA